MSDLGKNVTSSPKVNGVFATDTRGLGIVRRQGLAALELETFPKFGNKRPGYGGRVGVIK